MAKSSTRRHHAKRIQDKWIRLSKHFDYIPDKSLSFGKVFHQDPLDCGNPQCNLCHPEKNTKTERLQTRKLEKLIETDYEGI